MAGIRAAGLTKRFGGTEVIRGIDLTVEDREFCVLVGPSGCGKSTLLRMIAGLETIDGGELSIGATIVNGVAPKNRGVSMVFQSYALYPHMTVYRNMAFGLERAKLNKTEIRERVTKAAEILQIEALLDRKPRALSGGQRQRVAIGRAIVRDPKVFLFDEPLSNLDAALRVQMRLELRQLHSRLDATVIHVTHDQVEAMTLADRIVVMRDGRIEQQGAPRALYTEPANTFVAQFIGSPAMSLLPGEARDGAVRVDGVTVGDGVGAEGPVQIGVRPEHLTLAGPEADGLRFKVDLVEDLGESRFIHGAVGDARLTARAPGEGPSIAIGDRLTAMPDREKLHLFDAQGARIAAA